jgi:hypothetical protein
MFTRAGYLTLCLTVVACAPQVDLPESHDATPSALLAAGPTVASWDPSVVRARRTEVLVDVAAGEHSPFGPSTVQRVEISLFDDETYAAELVKVERGLSGVTWFGGLVDAEGHATITVSGGATVGTLRVDDRLFQLLPSDQGSLLIQRDERHVAEPEIPVPAADDAAHAQAENHHHEAPAAPPTPTGASDANTVVDVLVAYTATTRVASGGTAAVRAVAEQAVAEANRAYANSLVPLTVRLVHAAETTYDETGFDWSDTLARLRNPSDGLMDEIHGLRDAYGADHVVLLVETYTTYAGIGYQMTSANAPTFAGSAFSVVSRHYATGAYTFAHELGHNMGAHHDAEHASTAFFADSRGLQVPAKNYRTVMAYSCSGVSCPRFDYFSNPAVSFRDAPTGVEGQADNARTLSHTSGITSAFRPTTSPPTTAEIRSPAAGSELPAEEVTFSWNGLDDADYVLTFGSAVGDDDLGLHGPTVDTSVVVSDLPEDGRRIYARLWTRVDHSWNFEDYQYTASDAGVAEIAVPAAGSTLNSVTQVFEWNAGSADAYRLEVGTAEDATRYFASGETSKPWVWAAPLPNDGSAVEVVLWSRHGDHWTAKRASYTAYRAPRYAARLTHPAPGSTLQGPRAVFRWEPTAAFGYQLTVRRSSGELLFQRQLGAGSDSVAVSGLPVDGDRLVVTLSSRSAKGWAPAATSYVASDD